MLHHVNGRHAKSELVQRRHVPAPENHGAEEKPHERMHERVHRASEPPPAEKPGHQRPAQ